MKIAACWSGAHCCQDFREESVERADCEKDSGRDDITASDPKLSMWWVSMSALVRNVSSLGVRLMAANNPSATLGLQGRGTRAQEAPNNI